MSSPALLGGTGFVGTATETFETYNVEMDVDGALLGSGAGFRACAIPMPYDAIVARDDFEAESVGAVGVLTNGGGWDGDSAPFTQLTIAFTIPVGMLPQNVTITCPENGAATIYYTTDGSTPTTSSSVYSGPLSISVEDTVVKAFAAATNYKTSAVYSSMPVWSMFGTPSLWLRADALTSAINGDAIASWPDISGNAKHATQASASLQPIFTTGVANGRPVLRFDGTNDAMSTTLSIAANPFTIFVVYSCRTATSTGRRVISGSTNWLMGPYNNAYQSFNGAFIAGPTVVVNGFVLQDHRQSGSTAEMWTAKTLRGSNSNTNAPGTIHIGAAGMFSEPINGDVAEIVIYNTALSTTDRQTVENLLSTKYGL